MIFFVTYERVIHKYYTTKVILVVLVLYYVNFPRFIPTPISMDPVHEVIERIRILPNNGSE